MMIYRELLLACFLLVVACAVVRSQDEEDDVDGDGVSEPPKFRGSGRKDKLLVILLDGFRWDYAKKHGLKSLAKIKEIGVTTEYLNPVFPAMSFPNYYSLVTGMYVENHGMVMNYMHDVEQNKSFLMLEHESSKAPFWWEEAEPLWVTAVKKGKRSYLYLWPGGEIPIHGVTATFAEPYVTRSDLIYFRQHLDDALQRFKSDETDLAMVYCEYSDSVGHRHGPDSQEMKSALRDLDDELELLFQRISSSELGSKLNVIVVSDHGMTSTDAETVERFSLDSLINVNEVNQILGQGAIIGVFPKKGYTERIYHDLKKSSQIHVWKRDELPDHFHIKKNKRTPPIVVLAKKGVFITPIRNQNKQIPYTERASTNFYKGFHGYNTEEVEDMRGIFFGFGPGFEVQESHPGISIVDVYNIMMHFLDMEPLPNNGSWTSVYRMVKSQNSASSMWSQGFSSLLSCLGAVFIYSLIILCNSLWI